MKYLSYSIIVGMCMSIAFSACSPKTSTPVTEKKEEPVADTKPKKKRPNTPCTILDDLSPALKDDTETAYVLYKDFIKLKKYNQAMPYWRKAYTRAPAANGRIKYQFEDGIILYRDLYDRAEDPDMKATYLDTIMQIYDKRVECFGDPGYVAGRKAFDYYYNFPGVISEDDIYALFKEAIDAKGEKADYFIINPFAKIVSDKIINKTISLEEGREYVTKLWKAIEYGTSSGKNKEAWAIIQEYAPKRLENLEGVEGLYDCDYYTQKYLPLLEENGESCDTITMVYSRLLWGNCDREGADVAMVRAAKDKNCYTPPPPEGPLKKAFNAYNEGQYNQAIQLFREFVDLTQDPEKKAKYNLYIAKIYYRDIKNYPESRRYALKAAQLKPESGEPYLLIGKLYASSGPLCGPGRGWDSQIVTWPAIDMFEKAKNDPATSAEARKLIATYWQYMPKKEDVFFRQLQAGSSFKVGCWIQETTTIRTAD